MNESNVIFWTVVVVVFIFFYMNRVKQQRRNNEILSNLKQLESLVSVSIENQAKIETFLKNSEYFVKIGKRNDKVIYEYIYNTANDLVFKFKDFVPKEKNLNLLNDEALIFNGMHYERVDKEEINKLDR